MRRHKQIEKIAVANRGEVAARILHACNEMGLETVLLHSEADVGTRAYRMAKERRCIGPAESAKSYLNIEMNVQSALACGADAIHPGFGFLSENSEFASACEECGLAFIGPSAQSIRLFGDKISAKKMVESTGGPTIPGYSGEDQDLFRLKQEADRIGYPVIVKASAGGGGRGLKVILDASMAEGQILSAQRESQAAFGTSRIFLEKYLDRAKHIEVQIFGDASGRVYALGERECSVQRRHQKIIEESPAADLHPELRQRMLSAAVQIGEAAKYKNAGTVEFLVQDGQFYFMEMNTRLQVEHPVTEWVMGLDLVKAQILTAMGKDLFWDSMEPRGHSIECRIYAEDPYNKGLPSTGRLGGCRWPEAPGRRFEVGLDSGDSVTSQYDPMIAKVIVWDETRPRAIQKMRHTLRETIVFGVRTNIPLLIEILSHPEFIEGSMTTGFFEAHYAEGLESVGWTQKERAIVDQLKALVGDGSAQSPWTIRGSS